MADFTYWLVGYVGGLVLCGLVWWIYRVLKWHQERQDEKTLHLLNELRFRALQDKEDLKREFEEYMKRSQRLMSLDGVQMKSTDDIIDLVLVESPNEGPLLAPGQVHPTHTVRRNTVTGEVKCIDCGRTNDIGTDIHFPCPKWR